MLFTGLVEEIGYLKRVTTQGKDGATLVISCRRITQDLEVGDSVAVSGVCVTVTAVGRDSFSADIMPETIRRTTLADMSLGDPVNLECALRADGRLGGHLVTGHVDGVGVICEKRLEGNSESVTIRCPEEVIRYTAPKGSMAVDGVSLTVGALSPRDNTFTVYLIPHTANATTLGMKGVSSKVNLEADLVGKYIWRYIQGLRTGEGEIPLDIGGSRSSNATGRDLGSITEAFLKEHGF